MIDHAGVERLNRVVKKMDRPDEVRTFEKGKFEVFHVGEMTIGRATYEPGWKWSEHVGPSLGKTTCDVSHVAMVVTGRLHVVMDSGEQFELEPGDLFYVGPGHDSWVVGDSSFVSLHFTNAGDYARRDGSDAPQEDASDRGSTPADDGDAS